VITVISGVVGSLMAGVIGGAWGLTFGSLVSVVAWWLHFAGSMGHRAGQIHTETDRPLPFVPEVLGESHNQRVNVPVTS
jgi:hypothetical protein